MKCKWEKFFFVFEPCPTFLIFRFLIIKGIDYLIVFYDEVSRNIWNTHVSFGIVFNNGVKSYWGTSQAYQTFDFLGIFRAKPCHNTSSERMICEYNLLKSILLNYLIDFLASIVHRYIEKSFLIILLFSFFILLSLEKRWTIINNFSWEL